MKRFWNILGKFGLGAGTLVTLYGAFSLLDGIRDDVEDVKETQMEYQATADTVLNIARTYDERILEMEKVVKYNAGQVQVLQESYFEYLKNDPALTKDVFVEYMNPFLEYIKKNSSPTVFNNQTPSGQNGGDNITGHIGAKPNSSH